MNYEILINENTLISGSIYTLIFLSIIALGVLWLVGKMLWKKLRAYEDLKYEFVTIIAHKFRTPLTQTKWILETMLESEQDGYRRESLSDLSVSNERLINLTNTLVELTDSANQKLAAYNFERINLYEITNKVVNSLTDQFHEKNLFFGVKCDNPEIFVKVDRQRMEFVIQTIVENSISYSSPGRDVNITVAVAKGKGYVEISDNGIGIDPAEISRIFTKFFRSKNAETMDTDGFGVGLFLAQSIVKRHGGKIIVYSEGLGKGSTFTVELPLSK